MSVALAVAVFAALTAVIALVVSIRAGRRLLATQAELASANVALDQERQATAESIAAVHRSTVEEVTTLLENVLAQVDTDVTAKVAEALALLSPIPGPGAREGDHSLKGTSTIEPSDHNLETAPTAAPADL